MATITSVSTLRGLQGRRVQVRLADAGFVEGVDGQGPGPDATY